MYNRKEGGGLMAGSKKDQQMEKKWKNDRKGISHQALRRRRREQSIRTNGHVYRLEDVGRLEAKDEEFVWMFGKRRVSSVWRASNSVDGVGSGDKFQERGEVCVSNLGRQLHSQR